MNFERYYSVYARGGTPYELSVEPPAQYEEQVERFAAWLDDADCVLVGGASGLSAAGGGDFYYGPTKSFWRHFGKFAKRYGFRSAFEGSSYRYNSPEDKWAFLSTFLDTTLSAPVRKPYADLAEILEGKDHFVLTTNQDTQAIKAFPEEEVAEIQGDHRFFQCARCCTDDLWDAVEPVRAMIDAQGDGTTIPSDLIPRCPHCGEEAFPWVRGYGNFLEGERYQEQYRKVSDWIAAHEDSRILFVELGAGRMTPMFIQEPFWILTSRLPQARYLSVNDKYAFLPKGIEDRGMAISDDITKLLDDVRACMGR